MPNAHEAGCSVARENAEKEAPENCDNGERVEFQIPIEKVKCTGRGGHEDLKCELATQQQFDEWQTTNSQCK